VIGVSWLAAAAKATYGVLALTDLKRLICKRCGACEPTYDEPVSWSVTSDNWYQLGDQKTGSEDEERESPFDFYYYDELRATDGVGPDDY